ncbi:hypothetical protein VTK26DRAFT_665 [Humicola hyalothermophila]
MRRETRLCACLGAYAVSLVPQVQPPIHPQPSTPHPPTDLRSLGTSNPHLPLTCLSHHHSNHPQTARHLSQFLPCPWAWLAGVVECGRNHRIAPRRDWPYFARTTQAKQRAHQPRPERRPSSCSRREVQKLWKAALPLLCRCLAYLGTYFT